MKLDRRGFIKLIVGAGLGFGLTPLPWKSIDDVAIWTQNWPWVPRLTRYPDISHSPTVCTLCPGGCGISVRMVNGRRSIKAEGLEAAPANRGGVCPIGEAGPQYEYSLARFKSPLRRVGARGSGAFQKVTWDEAISEAGLALNDLREKGQANTVALITGRRHQLPKALLDLFMWAYGSPNIMETPNLGLSNDFAEKAQFGALKSLGYDLENSRYILSFGAALIEGWGSPVRSIKVYSESRRRETKIVQVDSHASTTASQVDQWVPVTPGSNAALALGLAQVIIQEEAYNKEFVSRHCHGFDEFAAYLNAEYTPEKTAALCGLKPEEVVKLAQDFAFNQPSVAIAGRVPHWPAAPSELMAVMALNALVGNINQPGGVIARRDLPLKQWPEPKLDDRARETFSAPRLDLAGSDKYPVSGSLLHEFVESVNSGRFYPVNALILDQANPAYYGVDPTAFRAAMAKIPLVISLSPIGDDTSMMADLILPATSHYEGPVDVVNPPTLPYPLFGAGESVMYEKPFDTLPVGDIIIELAGAIGPAVRDNIPFQSHQDMVETSMTGLFESGRGVVIDAESEKPPTWFGKEPADRGYRSKRSFFKAMGQGLFWYDPAFRFGRLDGVFETPSGKFEFVSQTLTDALKPFIDRHGRQAALVELGYPGAPDSLNMPHLAAFPPRPTSKAFPLVAVPLHEFKMVTTFWGNAPYLTKLLDDTTLTDDDLGVMVNPQTAAAHHLHNGDKAHLRTEKGQQTVRVFTSDQARPGVVYAPIGLGHTGYAYYLRGKGVNPLEIIKAQTDPVSGQPFYNGVPAQLIKA